jgi:hypothetical protein
MASNAAVVQIHAGNLGAVKDRRPERMTASSP